MNWKLIILLCATLASMYRLLIHYLRLRSAKEPIPANVSDVYDAEAFKRWTAYNNEKVRLSMIGEITQWLVTCLLLALNAHAAFAGLFPDNLYMQLTAVLFLEVLVTTLGGSVFGYIDTMKIEEKYGFNRTTVKTFIRDQVVSFVLNLVLFVLLASLLCAVHQWLGDGMVILFAVLLTLVGLFLSFIYPALSRINNKFVPLEEGELRDKLTALLDSHGYTVRAIEVMDASRRTTNTNAYFAGMGKTKTIVLYDNMLTQMTTDEIIAVFAHELGHGLHKDVTKQELLNMINMAAMALGAWLLVRSDAVHTAFGFTAVNYGFAFLLLNNVLAALFSPVLEPLMQAYSRFCEYRADRQAVTEGYGEALITGLKKLESGNFGLLTPVPLLVALVYSHPPTTKRIDAIEKEMAKLAK
ncbi:MAG: M48 family metallopeptidase [Clostridia bacterium]|nr:M48 family metallopeptidase [Clostridia bacterium]